MQSWSSWLTQGGQANDSLMLEILFGRSNADMKSVKVCWFETHRTKLEEELAKAIGNNSYNLLFQGCLAANKNEDDAALTDTASLDYLADALISQGVRTIWEGGVTSSVCKQFLQTLATASTAQINYLCSTFKTKNAAKAKSLEDEINDAFANDKSIAKALTSKLMNRFVHSRGNISNPNTVIALSSWQSVCMSRWRTGC